MTATAVAAMVVAATFGPMTAITAAVAGPVTLTPAQPRTFACGSLPSKTGGQPEQASAQLGTTKATLSGTGAKSKYGGGPVLAQPALKIWVGGKVIYSGPLAVPAVDANPPSGGIQAAGIVASMTSDDPLCVARFGGAAPEDAVMVGMYSGGAHCCTWADIYALPSGHVVLPPVEHNFGDPGVDVRQAGASSILVSADDSFAYEFDAFAFSGLPILVLEVQGAHVVNTTKDHLPLVAKDAKDILDVLPRGAVAQERRR